MAHLRIGDAERDAAVAALGEHYATGRLTREEFDERAARASAARFDADIAPLFADLPHGRGTATRRRSAAPAATARSSGDGRGRWARPWLTPLLLAGLVALVVWTAFPWWLLLVLFVSWLFTGGGCHRPSGRGAPRPASGQM